MPAILTTEHEQRSGAGHTPTPWTVWQSPEGLWTVKAVYKRDGCRFTCWPAVCNAGGQPNEANAAFIVRAVNNFDALVAALDGLLNDTGTTYAVRAERARAALDQAKG